MGRNKTNDILTKKKKKKKKKQQKNNNIYLPLKPSLKTKAICST